MHSLLTNSALFVTSSRCSGRRSFAGTALCPWRFSASMPPSCGREEGAKRRRQFGRRGCGSIRIIRWPSVVVRLLLCKSVNTTTSNVSIC